MDKGRIESAKLLIDYGADPTLGDYEGVTPFYQALNWGRKEIAEYIISHAAKVNVNESNPTGFTPLMLATSAGYIDIAKELIRRGAQVNVRGVREGNTPLHFAARGKDKELVEMLLAKGANPSAKNKAGLTPLDEALKAGNKEITEILQEAPRRRK
jgi:cytohesin